MNKHKKLILCILSPSILLLVSLNGFASVVNNTIMTGAGEQIVAEVAPDKEPTTPDIEEPVFRVLPDQLNFISEALYSEKSVHYYGFVALRGQKVMLSTPTGAPSQECWKVEHYENGEWKEKLAKQPVVFSNLNPGAEIIVRISFREGRVLSKKPYTIAMGSYPVLHNVSLNGPAHIERVPLTDTSRVLGLQTNSGLTLKVSFSDSTSTPLKGGLAMLRVLLTSRSAQPEISKYVLSDATGSATLPFEIGKCFGGEMTSRLNASSSTNHHWVSEYNVGGWYVFDGLIGDESLMERSRHIAGLAHICRQTLTRGRVNRW